MIYAAFGLWFAGLLAMAWGIHRAWKQIMHVAWLEWVILPGTLLSELAYLLGCLITGGEVHGRQLLPGSDVDPAKGFLPRTVGSMLAILTCVTGIFLAARYLGGDLLAADPASIMYRPELPGELPATWATFWDQLFLQVGLLRWISMLLVDRLVQNWNSVVFVYIVLCLGARLARHSRDGRAVIFGSALLCGILTLTGLLWHDVEMHLLASWGLLSFLWSLLLLVLILLALARGLIILVRMLAGKQPATAS